MNPAELIDWIASQPPTKEWVFAVLDYIVGSPEWALIDVGKNPEGTAFYAAFGHIPTRQEVRMDFTLVDAPVAEPVSARIGCYLH